MGILQLPTQTHPQHRSKQGGFSQAISNSPTELGRIFMELLGYHKICSLKGEQKTQKRLCSTEVPSDFYQWILVVEMLGIPRPQKRKDHLGINAATLTITQALGIFCKNHPPTILLVYLQWVNLPWIIILQIPSTQRNHTTSLGMEGLIYQPLEPLGLAVWWKSQLSNRYRGRCARPHVARYRTITSGHVRMMEELGGIFGDFGWVNEFLCPFCGGSKMMQMYGNFPGMSPLTVYEFLGWWPVS